jgi:tRNA(Ile)-lysidine synthase
MTDHHITPESVKLEGLLNDFFDLYPELKNQTSLAVAVSGGPDSMACAYVLYKWCCAHKKTLHAITVDHGLRSEAAQEAEKVAKQVMGWMQDGAQQFNAIIIHEILQWTGYKPETKVMEKARQARYALIADYCKTHNIKTLFVGHHQDDQAETFLIRLAKGSGLDGLAGMEDLRNYDEGLEGGLKIARPFLAVRKQEMVKYCEYHKIDIVQDSSNENVNYLRPRLRGSMQILHQEGLTVDRLSSLTRRLSRAKQALEIISQQAYEKALIKKTKQDALLDFEILKQHPEEISFRVLGQVVQNLRSQDLSAYNVRMEKLENLFEDMWYYSDDFKPRTLGGLVFALKNKNKTLYIKQEQIKRGNV